MERGLLELAMEGEDEGDIEAAVTEGAAEGEEVAGMHWE